MEMIRVYSVQNERCGGRIISEGLDNTTQMIADDIAASGATEGPSVEQIRGKLDALDFGKDAFFCDEGEEHYHIAVALELYMREELDSLPEFDGC